MLIVPSSELRVLVLLRSFYRYDNILPAAAAAAAAAAVRSVNASSCAEERRGAKRAVMPLQRQERSSGSAAGLADQPGLAPFYCSQTETCQTRPNPAQRTRTQPNRGHFDSSGVAELWGHKITNQCD